MKTDSQDCGAEKIDASASADQSSLEKHGVLGPSPRPCSSTEDARGACRFMMRQEVRGRAWLSINTRAISAETLGRIKAIVAENNRIPKSSIDQFAGGCIRRGNRVQLLLYALTRVGAGLWIDCHAW